MAGQSDSIAFSPACIRRCNRASSVGSRFFLDPTDRGIDGLESIMQSESSGLQWRLPIAGKAAHHCLAGRSHDFGFLITAPFQLPFERSYATDPFFQFFLGAPVCI